MDRPFGINVFSNKLEMVLRQYSRRHTMLAPVVVPLLPYSYRVPVFQIAPAPDDGHACITCSLPLLTPCFASCLSLCLVRMLTLGDLRPHDDPLIRVITGARPGRWGQNSLILPTHQVNALLMDPGGCTTRDYLMTGGGVMTIVFIVIAVTLMYLIRG